jgi:hypothetical protein
MKIFRTIGRFFAKLFGWIARGQASAPPCAT